MTDQIKAFLFLVSMMLGHIIKNRDVHALKGGDLYAPLHGSVRTRSQPNGNRYQSSVGDLPRCYSEHCVRLASRCPQRSRASLLIDAPPSEVCRIFKPA